MRGYSTNIKLYKNCILNNKYSEVFDNKNKIDGKTIFTSYLETLESSRLVVLDNIKYPTFKGILSLESISVSNDIIQDNLCYNYMTMVYEINDDTIGLSHSKMYYYFITDVSIKNDCYVFTYEIDIWHTFSPTMHTRNSVLCNKLNTTVNNKKLSKYYLPIKYSDNVEFSYENIAVASPNEKEMVYIVLNIQFYNTNEKGEINDRNCKTVILGEGVEDKPASYGFNVAQDVIRKLIINTSSATALSLTGYNFYSITNIYLIPANLILYDFDTLLSIGYIDLNKADTLGSSRQYMFDFHKTIVKFETLTAKDDFTTIGIGFLNKIIPIKENGDKIKYTIKLYADTISFKFLVEIYGIVYDLTNSLMVDYPIAIEEGSTQQLNKINNNLAKYKTISGGIAGSISSLFSGVINGALTGNIAGIIGGGVSTVKNVYDTLVDYSYLNSDIFTANRADYTAVSSGFLNGKIGFCRFSIVPSNDEKNNVMKIVNNVGYSCNEIVDDLFNYPDFVTQDIGYDCIKFLSVNVYGEFPQSIAEGLSKILLKGIKIYFKLENV